jgi:hypothetical protein
LLGDFPAGIKIGFSGDLIDSVLKEPKKRALIDRTLFY